MKRNKILTITAFVIALSFFNTCVNAKGLLINQSDFNVAVVDVQKVVECSPEISALKTSQKNDLESLVKFVEGAKADIAKEPNETKKKTLEESYNKELNIKKVNLDKEYSQKLSDYDKNITSLINKKAKLLGYNLVLTKNSVLNGGTDITSEIIKELK